MYLYMDGAPLQVMLVKLSVLHDTENLLYLDGIDFCANVRESPRAVVLSLTSCNLQT